jgi:hypothetical protein
MADHELRVSVHPDVKAVSASQEHWITGAYDDGLPQQVADFAARIDAWAGKVRDHYDSSVDSVDLARGWAAEEARAAFIEEAEALETDLTAALGPDWTVVVSPEPGVSVVRLMGEYWCEWPLWNWEGGTRPDDWPMLSEQLRDRLSGWAALAEAGRGPGPDADLTERLVRDVRRELGEGFIVEVLV